MSTPEKGGRIRLLSRLSRRVRCDLCVGIAAIIDIIASAPYQKKHVVLECDTYGVSKAMLRTTPLVKS